MIADQNQRTWMAVQRHLQANGLPSVVIPRGRGFPHPREAGARLTSTWPVGQIADYTFEGVPGEPVLAVREFADRWEAFVDVAPSVNLAAPAGEQTQAVATVLGAALLGGALGAAVSNRREGALIGAGIAVLLVAALHDTGETKNYAVKGTSPMPCFKGCLNRNVQRHPRRLLFTGRGLAGGPELKSATPVFGPADMVAEYREMVGLTNLRSAPALEFYDDLHGVGGIFSAADWTILVGVRDMDQIAGAVLGRWSAQVAAIYTQSYGSIPSAQTLPVYAREVATRRCIAHELGHALIYSGARNPYAPDDEAGADYWAGRLDAARGRSLELGEMFFWTIGCTSSSCDHPSPDVRAAAYRAGYESQLAGR
ncbi:MAG: hypothetical protein HY909_15730 [Deltaproteobacteria bacterium]|nr:hypothetical protein [Deltaproteobacteria bacterium]